MGIKRIRTPYTLPPLASLTFLFIVAFAALISGTSRVGAQTADVAIEFVAERNELTVGDPVSLTLRATYPRGHRVVFPRLPDAWGDLEVRDQRLMGVRVNNDGTETASKIIEAAIFATGTFETPEMWLNIYDPSGQLTIEPAPTVTIDVASVLSGNDAQLREIKPQTSLPLLLLWPLVIAGAILLGLIGAGVYLLVKRIRSSRRVDAEQVMRMRTPYEVARDDLAQIEQLDLPGQARFKEHYTLVADSVRRYLEGAYQLPALDQSTYELRRSLQNTAITSDDSFKVIEFLEGCDLVKFANVVPETEDARQCTDGARSLVELLTPRGTWSGRAWEDGQ